MSTQKNFLTRVEKEALERIAYKSKMDCWFSIRSYGSIDLIYDLEDEKILSLEDGIGQLTEGITDSIEFYGLTFTEGLELNYLFEVLCLSFRFVLYGCKKFTEYESLCRRVRREFEQYKREIATLSSDKIICFSYQTVIKQEIMQGVENHPLSAEQIQALVKKGKQNILDYLYGCYLDADIEISTLFDFVIRGIIKGGVGIE